jgi:energy-dependent translational throttle protein EttA
VSAQFIFTMQKVSRFHPPDKEVLKDITLAFYPGAKIGVLGANGAGKSSLLRIMAGDDDGYTGQARLSPCFGAGLLEQEPQLDAAKDVLGNVMDGVGQVAGLLAEYDEVMAGWAEPDADYEKLGARQADLETKIEAAGAWDLQRTIDIAMDALRLPPGEAEVTNLSGGERRRVALCRLLLEKPDLLLLDEPTNHLDAESVAWLEKTLRDYTGAVLIVTHDRYFLDNVTNWILEVDRGRGIPYQGNYSAYLDQKRKRLAQEEREESARQRQLAEEQEWIGRSPSARQAKSKARIQAYEEMLAKSQERAPDPTEIVIPPGPRLGNIVIEAEKLRKGYGNNLLIDDLEFKLPPGGIVGIIGPNGAGKSTLFRMITGGEKPDAGSLRVGDTVELGYVDQSRDSLRDDRTVWEEISDGMDQITIGKRAIPSRAYVSAFNFRGSDQQKRVGILSGGERNRVHLAKMLKRPHNVILLDEPTNDLDVDTLRSLEEALTEFAGCAVVISHDRWFLDRLATHILAFEGDSHVEWFEGNYQAYEADRRRRLGAAADQPHRIKYRPLTR